MKGVVRKLLLVLCCALSLMACKNGGENSESWFSDLQTSTPTTTEEVREGLETLPEALELHSLELLEQFYATRNNEPAWNDEDVIAAFLDELEKAEDEGLTPSDYHGEQLQQLLQNTEDLGLEDRVKKEFLLTDSFLTYAEHLYYGKLEPQELYSLWGVHRKEIKTDSILQQALAKNELQQALESLKPTNEVYKGLKESLKEYRELKNKDSLAAKIPETGVLKPGEEDERVTAIASRLKQLGFLEESHIPGNIYGDTLKAAIERFQKEKELEPDGIIGTTTIRWLNMTNADLYKKILVNLERWRWYPRDLGEHYIMVNIPDFTLSVIKEGDTIRKHNVVAGSKARKTPVFTDTLQYIVINPEWNIPPTIQNQDVIPKASKDPSYLKNNNMTVTAPNGERLDPGSIDWSSQEVKSYRFSQSAGPANPLGRVKIIYPNQYLIYLHDTPAKALFERNDRAESSGCVRVENAIDLSAYVINDQEDWNLDRINKIISQGKTTQVKITQPIQVHHFYWTAWRNNGNTVFADDVYDLDAEVYEALAIAD